MRGAGHGRRAAAASHLRRCWTQVRASRRGRLRRGAPGPGPTPTPSTSSAPGPRPGARPRCARSSRWPRPGILARCTAASCTSPGGTRSPPGCARRRRRRHWGRRSPRSCCGRAHPSTRAVQQLCQREAAGAATRSGSRSTLRPCLSGGGNCNIHSGSLCMARCGSRRRCLGAPAAPRPPPSTAGAALPWPLTRATLAIRQTPRGGRGQGHSQSRRLRPHLGQMRRPWLQLTLPAKAQLPWRSGRQDLVGLMPA
mmetsp:Transcript_11334/g.35389  ORF Transcript_11334/g.35389 Transcript_11334/m.35389 type:complete len:254 (+) Transcript_11334:1750-2511(+)